MYIQWWTHHTQYTGTQNGMSLWLWAGCTFAFFSLAGNGWFMLMKQPGVRAESSCSQSLCGRSFLLVSLAAFKYPPFPLFLCTHNLNWEQCVFRKKQFKFSRRGTVWDKLFHCLTCCFETARAVVNFLYVDYSVCFIGGNRFTKCSKSQNLSNALSNQVICDLCHLTCIELYITCQ